MLPYAFHALPSRMVYRQRVSCTSYAYPSRVQRTDILAYGTTRENGVWLVSDETYENFLYDGAVPYPTVLRTRCTALTTDAMRLVRIQHSTDATGTTHMVLRPSPALVLPGTNVTPGTDDPVLYALLSTPAVLIVLPPAQRAALIAVPRGSGCATTGRHARY